MADRYWVGGAGTWDASTTTNWATSSGGSSGASAPTSADNAIFDASSDAGSGYTITVGSGAVCNDLTMSGLDVATVLGISPTTALSIHGSMTLPATNLTVTSGNQNGNSITFRATTTGKTITTNGVSMQGANVILDGVGGGWTLGSAYTGSSVAGAAFTVTNGTFSTSASNYNMTVNGFFSDNSNTRTISFNASTITLIGTATTSPIWDTETTTNLTFNVGTSQITCSGANNDFYGGGLTFYNVSFTSTALGTSEITGANTFNNLTFTSRNATGQRFIAIGGNQTVSGTLTIGAANTAIRRIAVYSNIRGTQRTITLNGTLATLADVDFVDIATAGTVGTWTGTRIGNGLNNSGITFTAAADKYWNLAAGGNWSATGWALSSGGAVAVNNFPLPQDKIIIENTGLNTSATITINLDWWIGELDISTRTNAMTLASGTADPIFFDDIKLSSAVTMTGTSTWRMWGYGITQILDVNTATFVPPINIESVTGTLQLAENTTFSSTVTLTSGTLDLNDFDLTCNAFSSSNSNTRVIDFGTGEINVTGNNATVLSMGTATNFSYLGTPIFNFTYSGSTGTRTTSFGGTAGGIESNVPNINITAGTDIINTTNQSKYKNLNFTGFSGTFTNTLITIFGNLTISSGMTLTAGTQKITFSATSGTQEITTNGKTLDFPISAGAVGGTVEFKDALTIGSTKLLTLNPSTIKFKNGTTNSVGNLAIAGTVSNQVVIQSSSPGNTYTLSATSGPVNAYYATITDCVASPITLGTQLLGNMAYSGLSFSVNAQDTNPLGVFFKDDGTKMYINGQANNSVFQYSLSKPWNPSTATYDSVSFSYTSQDAGMEAIFFKTDGTKMYLIGNTNDAVYQYSLSSAWNLSTASYDNISFSVAGQYTDIRGLFFKPDGTKMYVTGTSSTLISQYTLGTPWDLSTASFDSITFDAASQDTNITGITFTSNGTTMILMGSASDSLYQYTLSTPWNISTATYDSLSFYVLNISGFSFPRQIYLKESSYILYFLEATSDSVFQLNVGNKFNAFRGAGNIYSYGNINGGNNKGINFTPPGTQLIPFF